MDHVEIVEVGPRDGLQNIPAFVPTETKVALIRSLIAAGFKRIAEYDPIIIRKGGIELVFRTYRFDANETKNYVFFCVWEDRRDPAEELRPPDEWNPASRVRAVLQRKRHLGQQVLEIAISGIENEKDARAAFERRIGEILQPDSILPAEITAPDSAATTAR